MLNPNRSSVLSCALRARPICTRALTAVLLLLAAGPASARVHLTPLHRAIAARASAGADRVARAAAAGDPLVPDEIRRAYSLPATGARGQVIAVISAYDDPAAQADLNAYSSQYGLPACTAAHDCFRKLNQSGHSSPLPGGDASGGTWTTESATGIEIARGVCTSCSILLVEANTTGRADLSTAVKAAADAGATVVVTTFLFGEDRQFDPLLAPDYAAGKAAVVSAAGDAQNGSPYGYSGASQFPSSLPHVLAVGGTELARSAEGRYRSERAWTGTVSGCSLYEPASTFQIRAAGALGCQRFRPVADVSAMAEPGAVVHITGSGQPGGPWFAATGTSLAAPIIAGAIGLAGSAGPREPQLLYGRAASVPATLHDVLAGANAAGCRTVVCRAARGYDGPTGFGTPFGLGAFLPGGGVLSARRPQVGPATPRSGVRATSRWRITVPVRNNNAYGVTGSIALQRRLRIHGRTRLVTVARGTVAVDPLASHTLALTISSTGRSALRTARTLNVSLILHLRGTAGRAITVTKTVTLRAP